MSITVVVWARDVRRTCHWLLDTLTALLVGYKSERETSRKADNSEVHTQVTTKSLAPFLVQYVLIDTLNLLSSYRFQWRTLLMQIMYVINEFPDIPGL